MLEIAGDVASAAGVFAGLVLVFFGAALASFDGYDETQKGSVRWTYRRRAWPAFISLVMALAACGFGLYAKAEADACVARWAVYALAISCLGILLSAAQVVWDVG